MFISRSFPLYLLLRILDNRYHDINMVCFKYDNLPFIFKQENCIIIIKIVTLALQLVKRNRFKDSSSLTSYISRAKLAGESFEGLMDSFHWYFAESVGNVEPASLYNYATVCLLFLNTWIQQQCLIQ